MRLIGLAIALAASLALAPLAVEAQRAGEVSRIGFLSHLSSPPIASRYQAFQKGLRDLGWLEGKNITIEYRFAEGKRERLPELAGELLSHKVEIVVVEGGEAASVVQKMSNTIPVVMAEATAPVVRGLVQSLARPGGNIAGLSISPLELIGKRLELIKEIVPKLSRLGVLWNPRSPASSLAWKEIQIPARQLGVKLHSLEVRSPDDYDKAFGEAIRARANAVIALGDADYKRIAQLAAKSRLPSIADRALAESGGLVGYGLTLPTYSAAPPILWTGS